MAAQWVETELSKNLRCFHAQELTASSGSNIAPLYFRNLRASNFCAIPSSCPASLILKAHICNMAASSTDVPPVSYEDLAMIEDEFEEVDSEIST